MYALRRAQIPIQFVGRHASACGVVFPSRCVWRWGWMSDYCSARPHRGPAMVGKQRFGAGATQAQAAACPARIQLLPSIFHTRDRSCSLTI